jgi:protein translocase SecG subunit
MSLLIGFLTFILVVNCLFLMLLVLVQLPKKEAGAGLAFGASTVDSLIGAGSGNALTNMTKYAAGIFLGLAVLLAVLNSQRHQGASRGLQEELSKNSAATPVLPTQPATTPATGPLTPAAPAGTTTAPATTPEVNLTPTLQQPPNTPTTAPTTTAPTTPNTATPAPAEGTQTKQP